MWLAQVTLLARGAGRLKTRRRRALGKGNLVVVNERTGSGECAAWDAPEGVGRDVLGLSRRV